MYGCCAYIKHEQLDIGSQHDKMEPQAIISYLISFVASNIWHIWIPEHQKVVSTHNVTFDESKQYDSKEPVQDITIQNSLSAAPVLANKTQADTSTQSATLPSQGVQQQ